MGFITKKMGKGTDFKLYTQLLDVALSNLQKYYAWYSVATERDLITVYENRSNSRKICKNISVL
jgi:hypothetical protein